MTRERTLAEYREAMANDPSASFWTDEPERPPVRYQITSVLPFGMFDTIIRFRAQRLAGRFGRTVTIAVDHRPARAIREALAEGIRPVVEPESWQVL